MIKVLVNGCLGKMGQEVIKSLDKNEDMILIGGFDRVDDGIYTFPIYTNINDIQEKPDVIIDFSIPVATLNILQYAKNNHIPIVIATTGFTDEQENLISEYSKTIPIFKSSNMSISINLMTKVISEVTKVLKNADIEIIETHHNRKVDSPSGTALLLANTINEVLNNQMEYVYDRHTKQEKRNKNEIGITSIRGGNIVGEHKVEFFEENEKLEISHTCYSRSVFADGAVKAARFIVTKNSGLYNMKDLV